VGCWICQHQVTPQSVEAVGTCSDCWIHACDDHGERLSGGKFRCAVNTAKVSYSSLAFAAHDALPIGSAALGKAPGMLVPDGLGPGSWLWALSAEHREYWRGRIADVLGQAEADPNSPWFRREVPVDPPALVALADLVGLVAWYLGLRIDQRYPSLADAREITRAEALALAWLFELLKITPAEVAYLLRYYADTIAVGETSTDWGFGPLHESLLSSPFQS
jgi:hypothetical protein